MSLQRLSIRYGARVLLGGVLLLLLALPILASPLRQNCATMGFNPTTVSASTGDVVVLQVPLDADGVTFDTAGFKINFDPTHLRVVDAAGDAATQVEPGDLPGMNVVNTASNTAGTIEFAQAIIGGHTDGAFNVATIRLKMIGSLAGGTQVMFVNGVGNTGVYLAGQQLLCEFPGPATITRLPPEPVGGVVAPVNKLGLLAPWLGLAALGSLAALTVALVRRRRIG